MSPGPQSAADAGNIDHAELWARIRRRLKAELGEDIYASWFARIELTHISHGVAQLSVPTKFLKSWIQSHYADRVLSLFAEEEPRVTRLVLEVRSAMTRPQPSACPATAGAAPKPGATVVNARTLEPRAKQETHVEVNGLTGNALDRRYTFASFLVGRSNALAHAAARKVAEAESGTPVYNPLYIHAGVGLGKTHLMQAICHEIAEAGRRVIYLTADGFMYGFVSALKSQNALAFKERLRAIDLLVIDDVQFLQGKSIQQEFCHTMNALLDAGKQIVVAADRAPGDLESLDERVRSRLAGGLVVEMNGLDEELRGRILQTRIQAAKAAHPSFDVPPTVIAHVAKKIATNGRDLDGAVNRLLAHATLSGVPLTVEMADTAIRDLVRNAEPKKVKIEDIQKLVATHFNVSRADILSSRRTANVVRPRQIAMYLSKMLTLRSLPEIGRRFGGRDHTTVLHAVRKVEGLVSNDTGLRDDIELLKRMLVD